MTELFADRHLVLTVDEDTAVVRYQRTDVAFGSVEEVEEAHARLFAALSQLNRATHALLIDLRATPESGRDAAVKREAMEQAMARLRPELLRDFRKVAFVLRSVVGELQLDRHVRNDGVEAMVTRVEADALKYLADA